MSASIDQAFVYDFARNVYHLGQQKGSRIRATLKNVKYDPGSRTHFERLASAEMIAKSPARNLATPVLDVVHSKRYTVGAPYVWSELIDHSDAAQALIDPRSAYTEAAMNAYGRLIDTVVLAAATGLAGTGLGGTSTQALGAGQLIGTGATGLTLAQLREAKAKMDVAEIEGQRYCACPSNGIEDLLTITEATSSDYAAVKALVQGEIDTFLGFKFVRTERTPLISGRKTVVCYAENALGLHLPLDGLSRVAEDPGRSFALRVYLETVIGAVRIEEAGVVQIDIAA